MIQALKYDSSAASSSQATATRDGRSPESFDPTLAMMVAQMLGSMQQAGPQQAAPKGAAPVAPRPDAVPRASETTRPKAPAARPTDARPERVAEPVEHRAEAMREDAPATPAKTAREAPEAIAAADEQAAAPQSREPQVATAMVAAQQVQRTTPTEAPTDVPPVLAEAASEAAPPVSKPETEPQAPATGSRLQHQVVKDQPQAGPGKAAEVHFTSVPVEAPIHLQAAKEAPAPQLPTVAPAVETDGTPPSTAPLPADVKAPVVPVAARQTEEPAQPVIASTPGPLVDAASPPAEATTPVLGPTVRQQVASEVRAAEHRAVQAPTAATAQPVAPTPPVPAVVTALAAQNRESGLPQSSQPQPAPKAEVRVQGVGTFQPPTAVTASTRTSSVDAPPPVKAPTPHPALAQVDGTIRWILKKQEQGADLQLHPESLGKVQIKLTVEGQQVHAQVWASEPATLPILRENLAFLEVSLREQGLTLGNFQLQQGDRGQDAGFAQPTPRTSGGGLSGSEPLQEVPLSVPAPLLGAYRIEVFA